MVISVSRRTDIPNYYSDWFYQRIKEGFVEVKNPIYPDKKSKINLSIENVDCFVFWTKNPKSMLNKLDELKEYQYYFQFTLNGYESDIEPGIPDKDDVLNTFRQLSETIGRNRVIWRYDPILITEKYSIEYHIEKFDYLAEQLNGYTNTVVISFLDLYGHSKRNMATYNVQELSEKDMRAIAKAFVMNASKNDMKIVSCAEKIDLKNEGVEYGHCIDQKLIEDLVGHKLKGGKDKNQRIECGCFQSRDIGVYNTCQNGCKYCYANYSIHDVNKNIEQYDVKSSQLC